MTKTVGLPTLNKWTTFCASAWVQICAGLFYCFGAYAPVIKETFKLQQTQIQTLGAALMFGAYLAPPGGALYERTAHHPLGPRLVIWLGAALGLVGYGAVFFATSHAAAATADPLRNPSQSGSFVTSQQQHLTGNMLDHSWTSGSGVSDRSLLKALTITPAPPAAAAPGTHASAVGSLGKMNKDMFAAVGSHLATASGGGVGAGTTPDAAAAVVGSPSTAAYMPVLMLALVLAGCSGNLMDTGALVTNVRNFPTHRGRVIGVLKALLGLGPSLFTTAYHAFLAPNAVAFIALLALAPTLLVVAASVAVNLVPTTEANSSSNSRNWRGTTSSNSNDTSNANRFAAAYVLVSILALNQLAGSLLPGGRRHSAARVFLAIAVSLLVCLMGIAWVGSKRIREKLSRLTTPAGEVSDGCSKGGEEEEELTQLLQPTGRATVLAPITEEECDRDASAVFANGSTEVKESGSGHLTINNGAGMSETIVAAAAIARDGDSISGSLSPADGRLKQYMQTSHSRSAGVSGGNDMATLKECFLSAEFWLLFLIFATGVGSGLAFSNNLPELVAALGAPAAAGGRGDESDNGGDGGGGGAAAGAVALVSLFSVGSCCGRLLFGYLPEQLLLQRGLPRPFHLVVVMSLISAVNLGLGLTTAVAPLYPLALVYGVGFGALWCLVPAVASEVFGLEHFASVYTSLILAPALGCWLLAAQLAGRMYDAMSTSSSNSFGGDRLPPRLPPHMTEVAAAAADGAGGDTFLTRSGAISGLSSTARKFVMASSSVPGLSVVVASKVIRQSLIAQELAGGGVGAAEATRLMRGTEDGDSSGDGPACLGPECFRLTFFVLAALCGGAAVAAARLLQRTQASYNRFFSERLAS